MLRTDYTTAGRVRRFVKIFLDLSCAFAKLVLLTTKHNVKASVMQAIILIDFNYFIITIFLRYCFKCLFSLNLLHVRSYLQKNLDLMNLCVIKFLVFPVPVMMTWIRKTTSIVTEHCYNEL